MITIMNCHTGIYLITHIPTERPYVGMTGVGFISRWKSHQNNLNNNAYKYSNPHFQRAWNKYGAKEFSFTVHTYIPQNTMTIDEFYELLHREETRILLLYPSNFNGTCATALGMRHKTKTKNKIKNSMNRPETLARLSGAHKGKPKSEEQKAKLRTSLNKPETKIRIGRKAREMWQNPEKRIKIQESQKITRATPEFKLKMSQAHKGKKQFIRNSS